MAEGDGRPRRLLDRLAAARARHHERHRPSGFGLALGDSINYLDARQWDAACSGQSLFLQRRYLRVLEEAGPDNLVPRYALIFRGREPVAAVVMQIATVSGARFMKTGAGGERGRLRRALTPAVRRVGEAVRERVLVCGNLLSWGFHAVAFAPGEAPAPIWPAVAEAVYRVRRAERLSGQADFALVKDLSAAEMAGAEALRRFGYRPVESDPNMVLDVPAGWRGYDDYLASLNGKYRNAARRIQKDLAQAGCVVGRLDDVRPHAGRLHALFLNVLHNAAVRPVTLPAPFFPALAAALGTTSGASSSAASRRSSASSACCATARPPSPTTSASTAARAWATRCTWPCCTGSSTRPSAWVAGASRSAARRWSRRRGWGPSPSGCGCGPAIACPR